jgi:hypothetical protein
MIRSKETHLSKDWLLFGSVLVGLAVTAGYAFACAWWPFMDCRRCEGLGKIRSPSGRAFRRCRTCKGSGGRLRHGRRVWAWLAGVKKSAID